MWETHTSIEETTCIRIPLCNNSIVTSLDNNSQTPMSKATRESTSKVLAFRCSKQQAQCHINTKVKVINSQEAIAKTWKPDTMSA